MEDSFGMALRQQRRKLNLSQREIAVNAGISAGYYSQIECDSRLPLQNQLRLNIYSSLKFSQIEIEELESKVASAVGLDVRITDLSVEGLKLVQEILRAGSKLDEDFLKRVRTIIREAKL